MSLSEKRMSHLLALRTVQRPHPAQVMSAGAIPVFVVRDWVRPEKEKIDWPSFSFAFSPDDVGPAMVDALRAVEPEKLLEMQVRMYVCMMPQSKSSVDYSTKNHLFCVWLFLRNTYLFLTLFFTGDRSSFFFFSHATDWLGR